MRQKLHNSRSYAKSPEFLQALGLFIFMKSVATTIGKLDLWFARLQQKNCTHTHIYIYTVTVLLVNEKRRCRDG